MKDNKENIMTTPQVHNKHANTAPTNAVYIGRPSKWGNPFVIGKDGSREEVITKHRDWILGNAELLSQIDELKGKDLVCYCAPQACHGDTLMELANNKKETTMPKGKFIIAGTGTRQLINEPQEYRHKVLNYLVELLEGAKIKYGAENVQVISGMAEGFDEALARAAVIAEVPFIAAAPNAGYVNYYWGAPSALKKTKGSRTGSSRLKAGLDLLAKAVQVVNVCKGIYGEDGRHANYIRNEWMADRASVVWVYNPNNAGGTQHCVDYCNKTGVPMFNIKVDKDGDGNAEDKPTPDNPQGGNEMNTPPSIEKLEKLSPETVAEIRAKLEENILPKLQADVSGYARGRMRTWMPYFAPLDSKKSMNQPFMPGILDDEIWQWVVDLCAKHGFKADTCLISKGGNILPHRDATYAAAWSFGINLGICNWHIASNRDSAKTDYTMSLTGGEVFKFNSKHTHAVTDASPDRWAINVWAIAETQAATEGRIHERLKEMMDKNPEVQEFVDFHQPTINNPKEGPSMKNQASFKGTFLSNFWPATVMHGGIVFPTVENFYQAMKVDKTDISTRRQFQSISAVEAKKKGKQIEKRKDWNDAMALEVMLYGLRAKFTQGSELAEKLLATEDQELIETNYWHDTFWGKCTCANHVGNGENKLGILLMQVREELKNNGGGGTPEPTPNNPKEGLSMKTEPNHEPYACQYDPSGLCEVCEEIYKEENYQSEMEAEAMMDYEYEKHLDRLADKQQIIDDQNIEPEYHLYEEMQEKTMKKKNETIKSWTFNDQVVQLKKTDDPIRIENNQSFYFVVNGNVNYPAKSEGIMNEEMAIKWAAQKGWAEMFEQNKKEEIVSNKEIVLNAKQQEAYDAIVNGAENILLTGNAGTGKSFLTKLFVEALQSQGKMTLVTATTGIAATHIEGRTYHSALRILPKHEILEFADLVDKTVQDMRKMRGFVDQLKSVHTIVVDEVSMMHPREFARIDKSLRQALGKLDTPFGGIRFVFVGDFLQIEPVEKDKRNAKYTYAFQTKAWHEAAIRTIQLTEVVRQQDALFAAFLNNLRQGIWTSRMERVIQSRKVNEQTVIPEGTVHFMSKNKLVDSINEQKLSEIDGEIFTFEAKDANPGFYVAGGVWKENKDYWNNNCLAPQTLRIKIGAQVMCLINDGDGAFVNGDTGVVVDVNNRFVTVYIHRLNCQMVFEPHKFHQQTLAPGESPTEYREQIPLKLSWAVTIHKSQGMTLDNAIVYADDIFAAGQMYVALSRVRSLNGLFIKSFDSSKVFADSDALSFYGLTGNLSGPAAESVCRMKALEEQGPDDTDNNGGTMTPAPKPNDNNDGGNSMEITKEKITENATSKTTEETTMNEATLEVVIEEIKTSIEQQAQTITPRKKGQNLNEIKEYFVSTASLADPKSTVYARVITNDPEYWFKKDMTVVHDVIDRGGYHYALLEQLFGDQSFIVNISIIDDTNILASRRAVKPEGIIFGYADFDSETMIRIKGHSSRQYSTLAEYGLVVGNSAKMTKRLIELVKAVRGYAIHADGAKKLRIKVLTHEQMLIAFPYLKTIDKAGKPADGISLLAVETAKYVYRANPHTSKSSKAKILREIEEKKVTNHTIRVLTNIDGVAGLVKGNALTAPRNQINSRMIKLGFISKDETYDIFTSVDNWKTELGTDGSFELITLEPHHEPGVVKTNDQTAGQYFGMPGMFDPKELLETFQVAMDKMYNDMVEGNDIKMLESVQALKARTEEEKLAEIKSSKVSNQVNKMASTLKGLDLGIGVSQTMMLQRANLIKKMFLSEAMPEGLNWAAPASEKKSFLFMPWSYRAYIMAKEVVYMLGYDVDLNNMEAEYHPETQTIMVPGALYDEIMAILGGGDADDEVMVHIRKMICKDGSTRLVAVLIRTPNDWGEYYIIDVNIDNMGPVFLAEEDGIEMPTIYEKDFDKFKLTPICGQLPSVKNGSSRPNSAVWDWDSTRYNWRTAQFKGQSVGGQVKTKMLQYSTFDAPFSTLPCANEDMIDALQQCKGDDQDLIELNDWSSQATANILAQSKLDAYWWFSRNMERTAKALAETNYLHGCKGHLAPHESPIVTELMAPRERIVRETYARMLQWLNNNILEIPELSICIHKGNQMKFRKLVTELNKEFLIPESQMTDDFGNRVKFTKEQRTKHFETAAQNVANRFAKYKDGLNDDVKFNKFILSLVRMSWIMKTEAIAKSYDTKNPRHNYDRWLYTAVSEADLIITDYFFDAMLWFRETYKNKS